MAINTNLAFIKVKWRINLEWLCKKLNNDYNLIKDIKVYIFFAT